MKSRSTSADACKLPMTPMIDVVCLLLIFFLVISRPQDLLSGVTTATAEESEQRGMPYPGAILLGISASGYTIQGWPASLPTIDSRLEHVGSYSEKIPVRIRCTHDSTHSQLVKVLDLCAKNEFHAVSVEPAG